MIQIIAGRLKGRKLKTPSSIRIRPTSAKVREAVFSIIGSQIRDAYFLDMFSGSGAMGIEAYSRGAQKVVLVEKSAQAARLIRENIALIQGEGAIHLMVADVLRAIRQLAEEGYRFHLIFIDPPYGQGWVEQCLEAIGSFPILASDGLILAEESSRVELPEVLWDFSRIKTYEYGDTTLHLYQKGLK